MQNKQPNNMDNNTQYKPLPPWSEMPDWAQFRAVDADGRLCVYEVMPMKKRVFFESINLDYKDWSIGLGYDPTDWQNSLEKRPNNMDNKSNARELSPDRFNFGTHYTGDGIVWAAQYKYKFMDWYEGKKAFTELCERFGLQWTENASCAIVYKHTDTIDGIEVQIPEITVPNLCYLVFSRGKPYTMEAALFEAIFQPVQK